MRDTILAKNLLGKANIFNVALFSNVANKRPSLKFQTLIASSPPLANNPFGNSANDKTTSVWPVNVFSKSPVLASHNFIV